MNETASLRLATEADAATIRALTREAYAKWLNVVGREPLPMRVDYHEAVKKHRFDLLYVGDQLAGLIETVLDEGNYLLLVNIAVHPAYQGRGFGKRLLKLADEHAASAHLAGVRLYTNKLFTQNIQLYESFGYQVEREAPLNGGIDVYMLKPKP